MVRLCWLLLCASLLAEEPRKLTDAETLEWRGKVWDAVENGSDKALSAIKVAIEQAHIDVRTAESLVRAGRPYTDQKKGEDVCDLTLRFDGSKAEYALYVPQSYDPSKPAPLVVELHGTGGDGPSYLHAAGWKEVSDAEGILVAAPTEPKDRGAIGARYGAEVVWETIRDLRKRYNVDTDRVYLSGFSRGGHATWWMGILSTDRFAGIGPRAGSPRELLTVDGNRERIWEFFPNLRHLPVYIMHGDQDPLVKVESARMARDHLKELEGVYEYHEFPGQGHVNFPDEDAKLWEFWKAHARDPLPKKVSWVMNDHLFARAWWARIDEERSTGGPLDIIVQDQGGKTLEKRTLAIDTAMLTAIVKDRQTIAIFGRNCASATLFLDDRLVDLDKEITLDIAGRSDKRRLTRSLLTLLQTASERLDPQMAFTVKVPLRLP